MFDKDRFKYTFETLLQLNYGKTIETGGVREKYHALALTIMSMIVDPWKETMKEYEKGKVAYYLSLEYLMGRFLSNNMLNIGLYDEIRKFIEEDLDLRMEDLEEAEIDAGLGNGGLGRLAACFMESAATCNYPLYGYGLRYAEGMFRQLFKDGFQWEEGDNWLTGQDPWSMRKESEHVLVAIAGEEIKAIPYDYPILGYETDNVNTLRLWQAEAVEGFDFQAFNNYKYDKAVASKNRAEDITRVLYPNDGSREGSVLRFKQQYFFCSASLQDMVRRHISLGRSLTEFSKYHSIQLNDTHPVIAIPELMRIFVDEHTMDFDMAWKEVQEIFHYTNHTILKEAMEQWPKDIIQEVCPRTFEYIVFIDHRLVRELSMKGYSKEKIDEMDIFKENSVRMAYLGIYASRKVNGVAELHSSILKERELKDWAEIYPEKFTNITNGITPRRWLLLSNPELTQFIDERIGTEWKFDTGKLKDLSSFQDENTLMDFREIKFIKKHQLAKVIYREMGIKVDPHSIFDVQVKRIHEYKRQLLNGLHIYHLYASIKENPNFDMVPRTFIFGGKAAPGYFRAKAIIKYLNELANLINNDPDVSDRLKVIFFPNYSVSLGQKIFPAADISEQISTAGKEASGTGNMKFMLNGTPTLGTLDGANVEIVEEAGIENNFIFGATVEELDAIRETYAPWDYYHNDFYLKRAVDSLMGQQLSDNHSFMFLDLYNSLLDGGCENKDQYFILKDFDAYRKAQIKVDKEFRDSISWNKKCLNNLYGAGKFSSDRSIEEYSQRIWGIGKSKI
ncbi:MAG: glycogen/starch/alpha-glucan phosphorylase [Tissierellia bacterium]|nr:glycogen/starch/alpha-glucan phosphorylase [Tissierellia bacterium]